MNAKCDACEGTKKIVGLGMITKECPKCLGTGVMVVEDPKASCDKKEKKGRE